MSLFDPLPLRGISIPSRVFVSPMCQYSAIEGVPTDWHLVHLGSRAVGRAGLVMAEATAVTSERRISPGDTGLWNEAQVEAWSRVSAFIRSQGSVPAVQLAHAGRKASMPIPWEGSGRSLPLEAGGWETIGPSPVAFSDQYTAPREMTRADLDQAVVDWASAAERARRAGFDVVEIHAAHGYLLHEFLSPLSNDRTDDWGGSLENRMRFPLRIAAAVRETWPRELPVFARISATDWVEGGWDIGQSVELARTLKRLGIDLVDCSSGGNVPRATIPTGPGYQVEFAAQIRREAGVATGAVGMITEPAQAERIIAEGKADAVLLARSFLYDPYWPLHAAEALGAELEWPVQYGRVRTQPRTISRTSD